MRADRVPQGPRRKTKPFFSLKLHEPNHRRIAAKWPCVIKAQEADLGIPKLGLGVELWRWPVDACTIVA